MSIPASALSVACALCGADCEAEARFCPHCGSPISSLAKGDDALTGEVLPEGWRLEERVGVDAIARLFRAERASGQSLIVRVVHDHLARNRRFASGFQQAVAAAARLGHPGVLRIKGSGTAVLQGQSRLYVLSEPFEGRNLCAIVQARGLLPVPQVLSMAVEVLEALDGAHREGVEHGDLLPENILIGATDDGEVRAKVANFSVGRLASASVPRMLCGGNATGTTLFTAPEVAKGEAPSVPSDLYSVGAILYLQLVGAPPFDATSCLVVERHHQERPVRPISEAAAARGVGPATEAVVLRALEKDPARRFASASEMLRALHEARNEDPPPTVAVASAPHPRTRRLLGRADVVDAVHVTALAPVAYGKEDRGQARGAVALLIGSAGMGKTAVLRSVMARIEGGPVAVLRVEGRRALARPLEPFTSLAQDALGVRRAAPAEIVENVRQVLETRFGVHKDECVRLLDRVTGRASSLSLTPDVAEREQVRSLRAFLGRILASRPTVLIVEDADAMDGASLELTRDLMEASATLALSVIVSSRSDPFPDWDAAYVTRLHLGNLEPANARAMIEQRTTGTDVPGDALLMAVGWSKGSPLLLELCARAMIQREFLVDRDGKFKAPSTSQDLFGGLRQLVSIALRGASPCARRWLSCAAVAGATAPLDLLAAFESPQPTRDAALEACLDTGLVHRLDDALAFDNEGVREVVRAMVPEGLERQLHMFVADWLRQRQPPRAPLEVIAAHLLAGGDAIGAAELFEREAKDLSLRDEAVVAAAMLARAGHIWQDLGDEGATCRVGLARVDALLAAGDGKAAADELSRLERLNPVGADGLRARVVAAVAGAQGNWELALQSLLRASDAAIDTLDQEAWFEVEFSLAELLYRRGRVAEAETHAGIGLELATSIADSRGERATLVEGSRIAQAATFLSKIRIELGQSPRAREALSASLEHTAVLGDQASASRLLANLAYACSETEDLQASLSYAQRALELALRAGDRMAASRIAINLGAYQARSGKQREALASYSLAKNLARAIGWARGVRLAKSAAAKTQDGA